DFRVSVQRNESGKFQITGIVAKVAAPDKFITNVAQGGVVLPVETLLESLPQLHPGDVCQRISDFSLKVVCHLAEHLPHLADVGLDIGITENGFPVFIECNGRDLRYSFQKGNMLDAWKATYFNPIG